MTAPGRTPCINPGCRRTAPAEDGVTGVVCGKCWRKLPQALRDEYSTLNRRERRMLKRVDRRVAAGTISRETIMQLQAMFEKRHASIWSRIQNYFVTPEQPIGLDGFLKEVGLS